MDKDCNMLSWLEYETSGTAGKKTVEKLMYKVCIQFQSKIASRRNYSDKWISGASSEPAISGTIQNQISMFMQCYSVRLGLKALMPALTPQ